MEHLLLLCPCVDLVWFGSPLSYKVDKSLITTFDTWLLKMFKDNFGDKEEMTKILSQVPFTCWHIWKTRYKAILNLKPPSPIQTVQTISYTYALFMKAK